MKCCAVAFSISVLAALSLGEFACVKPAGVDDGTPGALSSTELSLPSGSADDSIFIPLATITIPYLLGLETPIQFHHTTSFGMVLFNLLALYEEKAIDALGHKELWDSRRFCRPDTTSTDAFILHRRAAYAYAILFITRVMNAKNKPVIEATEKLCGLWGLDLSKCSRESDCDSNDTPWGLAHTLVEEMKTWMANDGWNLDGSLSREYNKRPYSDWREKPYSPSNAPWNVTDVTRWTPLLEDNGNGFAFHQVHVTPHIGEAGKSLYLRDEEFCRRQLPDPQYDLEKELFLNLQRSAALNDERKVELEFFDQKLLSLFPIAIEYFQRMGISVDSFEFWSWEMVLNAGYYDSTLLSWREKIRTGLARPTSVAMFLGAGKTARAYAGGEMGVQDVPVDQWEPYIRTMPHGNFRCLATWNKRSVRLTTNLIRAFFWRLIFCFYYFFCQPNTRLRVLAFALSLKK